LPNRLKDKVAIVTGGGTGIGQEMAIIFAREGAKVAICGRTASTLAETISKIEAEGGDAFYATCDVSQADQVENFVRNTVQRYGKLDVLVNNAGVRASILTILDLTEDEWQRTFDIDAKGTWLCSKYAIPEMRKAGGGSIIMISSISAYIGQAKQGCYNAAKGAQELLMKCMALDFGPDNIRVNSICPAWVLTEMNREQLAEMKANPDKVFPPGFTYSDVLKLHPVGRVGTPEDVAWAGVYLASDESTWVTGSSLMVDGGFTCQ
jgi:NAD(P)-dependent dehydrogenase (short-subunit alcohol dehydrogenase family)